MIPGGKLGMKIVGGFRATRGYTLNSGRYSSRALRRTTEDPIFHGFLNAIDGYMKFGKQSWPKQLDGASRLKIELKGSMKGEKTGMMAILSG